MIRARCDQFCPDSGVMVVTGESGTPEMYCDFMPLNYHIVGMHKNEFGVSYRYSGSTYASTATGWHADT
jgi:hypothetical protein